MPTFDERFAIGMVLVAFYIGSMGLAVPIALFGSVASVFHRRHRGAWVSLTVGAVTTGPSLWLILGGFDDPTRRNNLPLFAAGLGAGYALGAAAAVATWLVCRLVNLGRASTR